MRPRRRSLERSLAEAWEAAPGCPDPRAFLEASWSALAVEERRRIERHAEDCPACAAERDLARAFDDGEGAASAGDADVEWIVTRLDRARTEARRPGAARRAWLDWRWATAAALVVGLGGAYVALRTAPPPLPAPSDAPVVLRGAELSIVSPAGDLSGMPRQVDFEPVEGATSYRVRLLDAGGDLLWDGSVGGPAAELPAAVRDGLHGSVTYRVQVEALDATGARVALSEPTAFRVVPGGGR